MCVLEKVDNDAFLFARVFYSVCRFAHVFSVFLVHLGPIHLYYNAGLELGKKKIRRRRRQGSGTEVAGHFVWMTKTETTMMTTMMMTRRQRAKGERERMAAARRKPPRGDSKGEKERVWLCGL